MADGGKHGFSNLAHLQEAIDGFLKANGHNMLKDAPARATDDVAFAAGPEPARKFHAFLSYSHADSRWAKWLHGQLESARIDGELVGRVTSTGAVPRSLRPIFMDRLDFTAGDQLSQKTHEVIDASGAMILLCSPTSARSRYVNEEVRIFKHRHPDRPLVPVIIDGKPGHPDLECFPPAVRYRVGSDGVITDSPVDTLAADLRPEADGRELGVAKVMARMLGLPTDDVYRRAERHRKRAATIRNCIIAALSVLAVAAAGGAAYAWQQLKTNERFLNATLQRTTDLVSLAVTQAESYKIPRNVTLELLKKAEGLFEDMALLGRPTTELRSRKAWMLIQFARNYAVLGDTANRARRAGEALTTLRSLARENEDNPDYRDQLEQALTQVGHSLIAQGDVEQAFTHYEEGWRILEALAKTKPDDPEIQTRLMVSHRVIGGILSTKGNPEVSRSHHRRALALAEKVLAHVTEKVALRSSIAGIHFDLGDLDRANGRNAEALTSYEACRSVLRETMAIAPDHPGIQAGLAWCSSRIARLLQAQRKFDEAVQLETEALEVRRVLLAKDPGNARFLRDIYWSYTHLGDVARARGAVDEALANFREALVRMDRMSVSDERNRLLLKERSDLLRRIAGTEATAKRPEAALKSFDESIAVMEKLTKDDAGNRNWKCELATSIYARGEALRLRRDYNPALQDIQRAHSIFVELLATNDDQYAWLVNASIAQERIGDVLSAKGERAASLQSYAQATATRERVARSAAPGSGRQPIERLQRKIAAVEGDGRLDGPGVDAPMFLAICGAPLMWVVWR